MTTIVSISKSRHPSRVVGLRRQPSTTSTQQRVVDSPVATALPATSSPGTPTSSDGKDAFTWPLPESPRRRAVRLALDQTQSSCAREHPAVLSDHGWGVDMMGIGRELVNAFKRGQPLHIRTSGEGWHYARGVCPAGDLTCYFEQPARCPEGQRGTAKSKVVPLDPPLDISEAIWYLTRPKRDVAEKVHAEYATATLDKAAPCAAVHVRRSDTILNRGWGNLGKEDVEPLYKYLPVSAYVERALPALRRRGIKQLFMLTDDADAIAETKGDDVHNDEFEWHYIKKKRWHGAEGGWENHFPSGSPMDETVALLALVRLTSHCEVWVGSKSSFGKFLRAVAHHDFETIVLDTHNPEGGKKKKARRRRRMMW